MTGRDDLDELQVLAATISDDARGWRRHRRERVALRREGRTLAELTAPARRRKKHRIVAAVGVVAIAAGLVVAGLQIRHHARSHPPHLPSVSGTVPGSGLPDVRAGRQAAADINAEGRVTDVFSCQQWFDSQGYDSDVLAVAAGWHEGFMRVCMNAPSRTGSDG
jgi:hypothetical protein